jgi:sulfur relay (sulfurtransferase) DsrC/TusE family protein
MAVTYDDIVRFMKDYFPAYNEKGQTAETQHVMDRFYAPDVVFDEDGFITSREQWYKECLRHTAVRDQITLEHLFVDEKQLEAGALATARAIERATGKVLLEIKMNVLYSLKADEDDDIKIAHVNVFLESSPEKAAKLMRIYDMKK